MLAAFAAGMLFTWVSRSSGGGSGGSAWFSGGVPANWGPARVDRTDGGVVEAAWRLPGAEQDGFYPCLYVARLQVAGGRSLSTAEWLGQVTQDLISHDMQGGFLDLRDGAPAVEVTVEDATGSDRLSRDVPISTYSVFATEHAGFYRVTFMAGRATFGRLQPSAAAVMDAFRGSSSPGA